MLPSQDQILAQLNEHKGGFNTLIGLEFTHATPERVEARIETGPQHTQPYGLVHGGLYASIVETLCSTGAAIQVFASGSSVVGLDNHTSFLKASRGGVLTAVATPLRTGRRSQVWRAEVHDADGKLLAAGQVRLMVLEQGNAVAGKTLSSPVDAKLS